MNHASRLSEIPECRLALVSSPSNGDAGKGPISISELATHPLILPPVISDLRRLLDRSARRANVKLNVKAVIESGAPRKQAVIAGLGSTILPWMSVAAECEAGQLVARRIVDPPIWRLLVLIHRPDMDPALVDAMRGIFLALTERVAEEERQNLGMAGFPAPPAEQRDGVHL